MIKTECMFMPGRVRNVCTGFCMNMHSTNNWRKQPLQWELNCSRKLSTNFKNNYIAHRWIRAFLASSGSSVGTNWPKEATSPPPHSPKWVVGGKCKCSTQQTTNRFTITNCFKQCIFVRCQRWGSHTEKNPETESAVHAPRVQSIVRRSAAEEGWPVYRVSKFMFAIVLFLFVCTKFCMPPPTPPTLQGAKKNQCRMTNIGKRAVRGEVGKNRFGALMMVRNCHPTTTSTRTVKDWCNPPGEKKKRYQESEIKFITCEIGGK